MASQSRVIAGAGLAHARKRSRWPAWLDFWQSATGLILALFMWGHMFFVSSILLGKDAMWAVTKMFEGYFFFDRAYPGIVAAVVAGVIVLFVAHAALALRKFPSSYRQYQAFRTHQKLLRHSDTSLWFWQVFTGFALFFLASVHLYIMLTGPHLIGPYASADRVWSDTMWPLYILLLLAVEFHGGIGLYRLCVKWGWFAGKDAEATRANLKKLKWALTIFFLVLGFATLAAYMVIGAQHADRYGERYTPARATSVSVTESTPEPVGAPASAGEQP